jgi:Terminase small subunit
MAGKKKKKHNPASLTAMEAKFVAAWAGNGTKAARKAGFKNPKTLGSRLLRRPRVQRAIEQKQAAMIAESGKQMGKAITVTRNDIINRLDDLSQNAENDSTKVSALTQLKEIFGLSAKNDKDLFTGWTDEELEYLRDHGAVPPSRGGSPLGKRDGDTRTAQPPAATPD